MEYTEAVIIAIIVGLVELFKQAGLPKKASPLVALAFGIAGGVIYLFPGDIKAGIFMGLVMGLSASGLYSGGKTLLEQGKKAIDNGDKDGEDGVEEDELNHG